MKKYFLIVVLTLFNIQLFSQIVFEPGYFINETDQKTECLIKDMDWINNPKEFQYRLIENGETQKASIEFIKEFSINSRVKYIRARVKIDRSGSNVNEINNKKNPIFQEEVLFLKVLVEGNSSLYSYFEKSLVRYFYNKESSEITQLIYKPYFETPDIISYNNAFRQQLFIDLSCNTISKDIFEHLRYDDKDLVGIFVKYNECMRSTYVSHYKKANKDWINLKLESGLVLNNWSISNPLSGIKDINFESTLNFKFGTELELIFPFNKKKWSFVLDQAYQRYKTEKPAESITNTIGDLIVKVNYKSIQIPIGLRHYFYFNDKAAIFVNMSYVVNFNLNSEIEFFKIDGTLYQKFDLKSSNNAAFGLGFKYRSRYSVEFNYQTNRDLLRDYILWDSKFLTTSITMSYRLF